jgi:hypothetical protein
MTMHLLEEAHVITGRRRETRSHHTA